MSSKLSARLPTEPYLGHDLERPSETEYVPGERIERLHLQWRDDVCSRQWYGGLNARAVFELPAALEIDEVHPSCRQPGIALGVLGCCGDDVVYEDVLGRHHASA